MPPPARKKYDVVIVGSGASGGLVARDLAKAGAKVLLLEAGRSIDTEKEFRSHAWPWQLRRRGLDPFFTTRNEYAGHLWADPAREPYTTPQGRFFHYARVRGTGGKTLLWAGFSYRFSPRDFKSRTLDGTGEDWPIGYDDLAPYYDRVESEIGVCGSREGLADLPDGQFLRPLPLRCSERIIQAAAARLSIRAVPARKDALTEAHDRRPACHYCGHCSQGCETHAKFSTLYTYIPWALETGNCELVPNAFAAEILIDERGLAGGVRYVDTVTMKWYEARARVTVVAAGAIESARLLLLSRNRRFPDGVANSSGLVGKNLMEHNQSYVAGLLTRLRSAEARNEDGAYGHLILPRVNTYRPSKDFIKGYSLACGGGAPRFPGYAARLAGFGAEFKASVKRYYTAPVSFASMIETLPSPDNYVDLDAEVKDVYGLAAPRIHFVNGPNERAMLRHMFDTAEEILRAAGADLTWRAEGPPGESLHNVGTCKMGSDPKSSVVDPFCRAHDVRNLFVVDGSCFVSAGYVNPTITILAIAARVGDYMSREFKRGNL
jgi:choline dehydrogenase-like flavoprotein